MKKMVLAVLFAMATVSNVQASAGSDNNFKAKVDIMKEDQMDSTDVFAIPLDDSEVEDEEELKAIHEKEKKFEEKKK